MSNFIALLVTTLLLATPKISLACSIFEDAPIDVFRKSDAVVLAKPVEISPSPNEIKLFKENYAYLQTVTWQVIRSWKGSFNNGEAFVTTRRIGTDDCSGWGQIGSYQPRIFYSVPGSSFHQYYTAFVDKVGPQLDALKEEYEKSQATEVPVESSVIQTGLYQSSSFNPTVPGADPSPHRLFLMIFPGAKVAMVISPASAAKVNQQMEPGSDMVGDHTYKPTANGFKFNFGPTVHNITILSSTKIELRSEFVNGWVDVKTLDRAD